MKGKRDSNERIESGIPGLDRMIEGGFIKNSATLICGDAGTAKTLFCLQYLYYGAKEKDEPGVYIGLAESPESIYNHGKKFNWKLEELTKKNKFLVIQHTSQEVINIMEEGGGLIRDTIESIGAKRLVIDSLTAYEMFFENKYKANQSILGLFELLKKWKVTTLVTSEFPANLRKENTDRLGFLTEGLINLYNIRIKNTKVRVIEIRKMRDTEHNNRINIFTIGRKGLSISKELKAIDRI